MEPDIILFDEPTSALDPTMVGVVLSVIRRLARDGMTMAIVTHEMDFARDVSNRVFYMDEGLISEEGTPDRIFESPQKEKNRAFINRVRSFNYRINSPDYALYAMNAHIEAFCEKQLLPRKTRHNLLLVEELLKIYHPLLHVSAIDLTVSSSEKNGNLEAALENMGKAGNLLDESLLPDDLGLKIINHPVENIM